METASITLPKDMLQKIERVARSQQRSVSDVIADAYRAYREKQIDEAFEKSTRNNRDGEGEDEIREIQRAIKESRAARDSKTHPQSASA